MRGEVGERNSQTREYGSCLAFWRLLVKLWSLNHGEKSVAGNGSRGARVTLCAMTDEPQTNVEHHGEKAGGGLDRGQIRRLLELTPEERLEVFVASARNVAEFVASARPA